MSKHTPVFVPINFNQAGKALLVLGLFCIILKLFSFYTSWLIVPYKLIYIGIALVVLSLYLVFVVPKE